jgi:hypothetical protein
MPACVAGPCSVCAEASEAIYVRCVRTGTIFYACWSCGVASKSKPVPLLVDELLEPADLAVGGWTVATRAEVLAAELSVKYEIDGPEDALFDGARGYRSRE